MEAASDVMAFKSKQHCSVVHCMRPKSYGVPGGRPTYCNSHKQTGMIDLKHKLCEWTGGNCTRHPYYGELGEKPRFCSLHKTELMTNLRSKRCGFDGCIKQPSFGQRGQHPPTEIFCSEHKPPGCTDITNKKCSVHGCRSKRACNVMGKRLTVCEGHAMQVIDRRKKDPSSQISSSVITQQAPPMSVVSHTASGVSGGDDDSHEDETISASVGLVESNEGRRVSPLEMSSALSRFGATHTSEQDKRVLADLGIVLRPGAKRRRHSSHDAPTGFSSGTEMHGVDDPKPGVTFQPDNSGFSYGQPTSAWISSMRPMSNPSYSTFGSESLDGWNTMKPAYVMPAMTSGTPIALVGSMDSAPCYAYGYPNPYGTFPPSMNAYMVAARAHPTHADAHNTVSYGVGVEADVISAARQLPRFLSANRGTSSCPPQVTDPALGVCGYSVIPRIDAPPYPHACVTEMWSQIRPNLIAVKGELAEEESSKPTGVPLSSASMYANEQLTGSSGDRGGSEGQSLAITECPQTFASSRVQASGEERFLPQTFPSQTESSLPRTESSLARTDTLLSRTESSVPRTESSLARTESSVPRTQSSAPGTESSLPRAETSLARTDSFLSRMKLPPPDLPLPREGSSAREPGSCSVLPPIRELLPARATMYAPALDFSTRIERLEQRHFLGVEVVGYSGGADAHE